MLNLPSTKLICDHQCLEQSWRHNSVPADVVIRTSVLPCPCLHLIGKIRHTHSMESLKIREHFKGIPRRTYLKNSIHFQFHSFVSFFLIFILFLFSLCIFLCREFVKRTYRAHARNQMIQNKWKKIHTPSPNEIFIFGISRIECKVPPQSIQSTEFQFWHLPVLSLFTCKIILWEQVIWYWWRSLL